MFGYVEVFVEYYSRLVKSIKLSTNQPIGKVLSKKTVLDSSNYKPNLPLQEIIVHGLRNTSQHFEERLQDFEGQIDPFLKLFYNGLNVYWEITFGKGGG